jgi:hypothetical protein
MRSRASMSLMKGSGGDWQCKSSWTLHSAELPTFCRRVVQSNFGLRKHFIIQLTHTTWKRNLLKYIKIMKAAPICFGLQRSQHKGATGLIQWTKSVFLAKYWPWLPDNGKGYSLPQQAEVAQGVPGRLRPRIFLTFGNTRVVGGQP